MKCLIGRCKTDRCAHRSGSGSPSWKGGRIKDPAGYIFIKVGKAHHLANSAGYVSEHRMVAERKLGRRLRKGDVVHHINGKRDDNRPENLVVTTQAQHLKAHGLPKSTAGKTRLTIGQVRSIRKCKKNLTALAKKFGIDLSYACGIRSGKYLKGAR